MGIDSVHCVKCDTCVCEEHCRGCESCYRYICEHCILDIYCLIELEDSEEKMSYSEYLDRDDKDDDYYLIVECSYCTNKIEHMLVDKEQIINYFLETLNTTKDKVVKKIKEKRLT